MSGICGWFGVAGDGAHLETMASALTRFDGSTAQVSVGARAGIATSGLSGSSSLAADGELLIAVSGHPRFTDAALCDLAKRVGAAAAVASAYRRRGKDFLQCLHGAFSVAVLDGEKDQAFLAIDRAGIGTLCFAVAGKVLVFGSSMDSLLRHPEVQTSVDPQGIYNYVYFHMVPGPGTAYRGVSRLLPGQYLKWQQGQVAVSAYWEMKYVEDERRPFGELKKGFLGALQESIRDAASAGKVGAFLSGGTDSSTIAGLIGAATGAPARTYSIGFDAQGYDEMEYARIAAKHFRTDHHEYYVTPDDIVAAILKIASIYDQPFGNSSAVPTYYCALLAKSDGIDVMLGGDGGDELFGGNARYAKQRIYSFYSDLHPFVRKGLIEPIAFLGPEVGLLGKAQRYMRHASQPMPARYDNYNLVDRLGPENVFTGDFLASVDRNAPLALMEGIWRGAHASSLLNRMLAIDARITLADNDLPKVARSCELAHVAVRFPMLDDRVVDFSASLAPNLKLKGTRLRYFFKEALRGFLPDEIIAKQKHGFGLPFGPWLGTHKPLRDLAYDSLSALRRRGIVRPDFIDRLTSEHVVVHAGYFGAMVWVLMMLEQWYEGQRATDRHRPRSARRDARPTQRRC